MKAMLGNFLMASQERLMVRGLAKPQSLPLKASRGFTTEQTKWRSSLALQKALHLDYLCWRTAYEIQRCN